MARELPPCGTVAGYRRHLDNDEVPCGPCTITATASVRDWRHSRDRARLRAAIWRSWPTRGTEAERAVDAILAAADAYAAARLRAARRHWRKQPPARPVLRHTSDTDLWPVIRVLADALMPSSEQEAAA